MPGIGLQRELRRRRRAAGRVRPERGSSEQIILSPPETDANSFFGTSVAGLGDRDGDGFDDLLVGASGGWSGTINGGNAYTWAGGSSGLSSDSPQELVGSDIASGDRFGRAVAGPGDVDGDGRPDVLVGAYHHET
ncbi:MAG: hypothetical protein GXP62_18435, partial [Oligoflexia bacterium]|nr:hypothetical protein [Oligoflexia bacterium]